MEACSKAIRIWIMVSSLKAGCVYFLLVFAMGFALGIVRVLLLSPLLGEMLAVLIELPVILLASWLICRKLIERLTVPSTLAARLLMGATALALLLSAEALMSVLLFERSLAGHLELYQTAEGLTGLAGQIVFALFPVIQLMTTSD
jgi:hypothetical protein